MTRGVAIAIGRPSGRTGVMARDLFEMTELRLSKAEALAVRLDTAPMLLQHQLVYLKYQKFPAAGERSRGHNGLANILVSDPDAFIPTETETNVMNELLKAAEWMKKW